MYQRIISKPKLGIFKISTSIQMRIFITSVSVFPSEGGLKLPSVSKLNGELSLSEVDLMIRSQPLGSPMVTIGARSSSSGMFAGSQFGSSVSSLVRQVVMI